MHLDSVFNILSDNCCVMLDEIMGADSPKRRTVDEYTKDPSTHKYKLTRWAVGWVAGWLDGWAAGWLASPGGWLAGCVAGWLAGWVAGWLGGWLAAWLAG
jgi:hypothetical protein